MKIVKNLFTRIAIITLALLAPIGNSANAATFSIQQLMSLFSTLEGYSFIFRGLDENGVNLDSLEKNPLSLSYSFSESGATLVSSGTIDSQPFSLNYSGTLSGDYPNEDMSWMGTWSGFLGSSTIEATDTATFLFNSSIGGYDGLNFRQSGTFSDEIITPELSAISKGWIVVGAEVIGGSAIGALVTCWTGVGCLPGIGAGATLAVAGSGVAASIDGNEPDEPSKPPIDDPDPDHKTEVDEDGKGKTTIKLRQPNGGVLEVTTDQNCEITCDGNGTVRRIIIPESSSTLSLLALGILGGGATLKRKLKSANSIEKETTKVS